MLTDQKLKKFPQSVLRYLTFDEATVTLTFAHQNHIS